MTKAMRCSKCGKAGCGAGSACLADSEVREFCNDMARKTEYFTLQMEAKDDRRDARSVVKAAREVSRSYRELVFSAQRTDIDGKTDVESRAHAYYRFHKALMELQDLTVED